MYQYYNNNMKWNNVWNERNHINNNEIINNEKIIWMKYESNNNQYK